MSPNQETRFKENQGKRLKVAFLSFGFVEYSIQLANALAHEAEVLLLLVLADRQFSPYYLASLDQAVSLQTVDKPRFREPVGQLQMIYTLLQHIRHFDPDVIHLQQGHLWFNFALPLLRRYPLVLTIHDPRHHVGDKESQKQFQMVMDFGFHRAAQIIVHGKQLKQVVVDECRIASDNIQVIPHIRLGDDIVQDQIQEDNNLILFFGRIWEYKGLKYLIQAEPLITAQIPEARIIIAGKGEDFAHYRSMMVHPQHFIVYNEFIPGDKVSELFGQASIVTLPYIDATQSGVIPLAYTYAKPVVATTVGSLPEMVEHGRTGYLVPPCDEKALAEAIVCLLRDKELRHQFGANGKRKIETECSPQVVGQQTLEVYYRALNHR
jgi:glycosyltransferase involved in cell wall biosynthesis